MWEPFIHASSEKHSIARARRTGQAKVPQKGRTERAGETGRRSWEGRTNTARTNTIDGAM